MFFPLSRLVNLATIAAIATCLSCNDAITTPAATAVDSSGTAKPEYFLLRPSLEKRYGYSHAVRIGDHIKISGAVSMDSTGTPLAIGNMEEQMKNCYADLKAILERYGCTFKDVVVENIFTTDMEAFHKVARYRNTIYGSAFPTGNWLEVKGLALPGLMIEIEMEARIAS